MLGSFVIFQGVQTGIAKKPYRFVIYQSVGERSGPLDPRIKRADQILLWLCFRKCLISTHILTYQVTVRVLVFLNVYNLCTQEAKVLKRLCRHTISSKHSVHSDATNKALCHISYNIFRAPSLFNLV